MKNSFEMLIEDLENMKEVSIGLGSQQALIAFEYAIERANNLKKLYKAELDFAGVEGMVRAHTHGYSKETLDAYYVSHQSTSLSELPELNQL